MWSVYAGYQRRHIDKNYFLQGKTSMTGITTVAILDEVTDKVIGANVLLKKVLLDVSITKPKVQNFNDFPHNPISPEPVLGVGVWKAIYIL